jgi:drug/metabolite transporter (DMT)-like permease
MAAMRLGSQRAAAFIFTVPVSAMLFSALLLGEEFDGFIIVGGVFSVTAVYLINQQKNSHSKNLEKS